MAGRMRRVALVGATSADVREVMVEGPAGILAVCDRAGFGVRYEPSRRQLTFANGAIAKTYSAEEPDRLRGPEHDGAWSDEIAAWKLIDAWDNLQFGLRIGNPRQVATTTPRPVKLVRDLLDLQDDGIVVLTGGSTYENVDNLAPAFIERIVRRYEGTRLGRQELEAELLTDIPGALWTLGLIDAGRVRVAPTLARVVVGVDPAASDGEDAAETGIIVAGKGVDGHGYVLADLTISGSPLVWARQAVAGYRTYKADRVVAEVNNGGAMVEYTLQTVDERLPVKQVRASRGKLTRAEPIAALYEQGLVHHVGAFPALEDQLTDYDGTGVSPDRLDAAVWALTDLMLDPPSDVWVY